MLGFGAAGPYIAAQVDRPPKIRIPFWTIGITSARIGGVKGKQGLLFFILSAFVNSAYSVNADLVELRNQTKRIVESRHCYNCHSPEAHRPLASAMKIFNLGKEGWFSTLSDRQLKEFQRRMLTYLSPEELKEVGGNPNEKPLARNQEKIISKWVDAELADRHPSSLQQILSR